MFSLHDFILDGLLRAVGHMADYQIILNAVGWHQKAVLTTADLERIAVAIQEKEAEVAIAVETATAAFADAPSTIDREPIDSVEKNDDEKREIALGETEVDTPEGSCMWIPGETDINSSANEAVPT